MVEDTFDDAKNRDSIIDYANKSFPNFKNKLDGILSTHGFEAY